MNEKLKTSIQYIKGVGPKLAKCFEKLELYTVNDLIYFFPRSYEDRRRIPKISEAKNNETMFFVGDVIATKVETTKNRHKLFKANIHDGYGYLSVVWFNQAFLETTIMKGNRLFVSGKVEYNHYTGEYQLMCADYEILDKDMANNISLNRVVPVYNLTKGIVQKKIRMSIYSVLLGYLNYVDEFYEEAFRKQHKLMGIKEALYNLHYPKDRESYALAKRRIVFDDFFMMQLVLAKKRFLNQHREKGISFNVDSQLYVRYLDSLPYSLTNAQQRVINEIKGDMKKIHPMNRLVQGDVGSGKTEIAVAAIIVAVENGYQAALMAPTEILAEQHYKKLLKYLEPLGIKVELLIGRLKTKQKRNVLEYVASNSVDVVIGTHALIQEKVEIPNLGLAIVDEQHRFGVMQRAALKKYGKNPDLVVMTATPIPRTLSLTVYGDLDKSVIDEMPPGRKEIKTEWVTKSTQVLEFLRKKLKDGEQAYYVLPLVEESEKLDLKAAIDMHEYLKTDIYPEFPVGLIHGKMKGDEKDNVMQMFRNKEIRLLVATTVIEVGIDVPNATVMVIEHAERFGLSQLHQLRGRVGRGSLRSYCILIGNPKSEDGRKRLKVMTETTNGFKLAEFDLQLRGPGDFYGVKQSGLPTMRMADFIKDEPLLLEARKIAVDIIEIDPHLDGSEHKSIKKALERTEEYQFSKDAMN
ncbi:MAG TPA: DNA helicase RecG [Candidatus Margulisbacteria bacterium]|nr:MAG: ATP-dependent DNA helicase RecG [Candidatus Margulisbacteria bacterium GWD2_39_127]HAR63910.1 DNA helicase RecG [Candidatus Margulisiibacteriota bacterium]